MILRISTTVIHRPCGIVREKAPSGQHYPYACDTSRMYCARAEPCVNTATIFWTKPELVDQAIHQQYQKLNTALPFMGREPTVRTLPMSSIFQRWPWRSFSICSVDSGSAKSHRRRLCQSWCLPTKNSKNEEYYYAIVNFCWWRTRYHCKNVRRPQKEAPPRKTPKNSYSQTPENVQKLKQGKTQCCAI